MKMNSNIITPEIMNYINAIKNKYKIIVAGFFISAIVVFIISLFLPKIYRTTASITPIEGTKQSMGWPELFTSKGLSMIVPGVSSVIGGPKVSDYLINVLNSRAIAEKVIEKLNLQDRFKIKSVEKSVKLLRQMVSIKDNRKGLIEITADADDPNLASTIVNTYIDELDGYIQHNIHSSEKAQRIFIEKQLQKTKEDLFNTEIALKDFQKRNKTVVLPEETKEEIKIMAKTRAEIAVLETELASLRSYMKEGHSDVKQIELRLAELKKKQSFENTPLGQIPEKQLELTRLTREMLVQEAIYISLVQQYESAKISEAREDTKFSVIDRAVPPERHIKPKKATNALFAGIIWLFISLFTIIIKEELST